jgi:putative methionine-R-sulfoxide reductase with GAF domain
MMRIHLSIGQRVTLGFLIMIVLVILASGVGLLYSRSAQIALDSAYDSSAQIQQITTLQLQWDIVVRLVDKLLLTRQTSLIDSELNQEITAFNRQLADLQKQSIGQNPESVAKNQQIIKNLQQIGIELTNVVSQITEYAQAGSWARAQTLRFTEMSSLQRRLTENFNQLNLNIAKGIDEEIISSNARQNSTRTQLILITIFAVVMSSALGYITTRSITSPVAQLLARVQKIMSLDFSRQETLQRDDEFGKLSEAMSLMTDLVRETYEELEHRVAARTKGLATVAEVSRRLTTAASVRQLAVETVEQLQAAFGYYHAHIYFVDEASGDLVMAGGTGEAGAAMLASGHRVPKGRGLVGRAAETNAAVLVPDVSQEAGWLPNPLLPETKSEIAVPIALGGLVLGVLDVQQNIVRGLDEEDVTLLQAIAAQVAISLQNVRDLEASRARADLETLVNAIGQKIQRAATIEETLQTAARELGAALGAQRVKAALSAQPLEAQE